MLSIGNILDEAIKKDASDVHICINKPVIFRVDDILVPYKNDGVLSKGDTEKLIDEILTDDQKKELAENLEIDFAYNHKDLARFRTNVFFQNGTYAAALRLIPSDVRTIEDLELPDSLKEFADKRQGLFLAVGPAGHGKSTTIAAMVDYINKNRTEHIITIEDPIEYLFKQNKCLINQREVMKDTKSFKNALRSALRQDPDIVFVGEMRDLETISTALTIAETGHLVFSTLHTNNAAETIDRMVDVFPPHQQEQIRYQIASTLQGVVSQRLVPRVEKGRIAATEILKVNPAVQNTIREGKTFQIINVIQTNMAEGMTTLDASLVKLVKEGKIKEEDAMFYAQDQKYVKKLL